MSKWRNGWNDTDEYSTNEVKTNKVWIDGKPIYRKCFYSATNWADETVIGNISDVDLVINIKSTSWNYSRSAFYTNYDDTSNMAIASVVPSNGNVVVNRKGAFVGSTKPSHVIIEYTKATN